MNLARPIRRRNLRGVKIKMAEVHQKSGRNFLFAFARKYQAHKATFHTIEF